VQKMRRENVGRPGLEYATMDARDLQFEDRTFDVVFDKSTLDALKCDGKESVGRFSREVHRVLKDDGKWLCVTLHEPEVVAALIATTSKPERHWNLRSFVCEHELMEGDYTYLIVATKKVDAAKASSSEEKADA